MSISVASEKCVVRAISLPVAAPVGIDWKQLVDGLGVAWRLSTDLGNWIAMEMLKHDVQPVAGGKLPAFPGLPAKVRIGKNKGEVKHGAYRYACEHYPGLEAWQGSMRSFGLVIRAAEAKYRKERFGLLARHEHRLFGYRYPAPYPVHNQELKLTTLRNADGEALTEDHRANGNHGFPSVSLTIPSLGRVTLRLKRSADLGRQLSRFRDLLTGVAKPGEAALYQTRKGDLMLKIVGKWPVIERDDSLSNAALIMTDPSALYVVEVYRPVPEVLPESWLDLERDKIAAVMEPIRKTRTWILNADHLVRRIASHRVTLQRLSEDNKREKRQSRRQRLGLAQHREDVCRKHESRMRQSLGEITEQISRFLDRQMIFAVTYLDGDKSYCENLQWHRLKTMLKYKLEERGVRFYSQ